MTYVPYPRDPVHEQRLTRRQRQLHRIRPAADALKVVNLATLIAIAACFLAMAFPEVAWGAYVIAYLACLVALIRTGKPMEFHPGLILAAAILMLLPAGAAIILIALQARLREFFKALDVSVLLGPNEADIAHALESL